MKNLMLKISFSLFGLVLLGFLEAADDATQSTCEYASMDNMSTINLMHYFEDSKISDVDKKKLAEKIAKEPGSYNPIALLLAGLEFLKDQQYDRAARLCIGASCRAEIDIRLSQDKTVGGILTIFKSAIGKERAKLKKKDREKWQMAFNAAVKDFEAWDRATPRNYDPDWISPHGPGAFKESSFTVIDKQQREKIIERFYRELREEVTQEDLDQISKNDQYYFDQKTNTFYFTESKISFTLPKQFGLQFDRWGKLDNSFKLPNEAFLGIEESWSLIPKSLEKVYESVMESKKEKETIEQITIGEKIPAFRKRCSKKSGFIVNTFYIVKENYVYDFNLYSKAEDEEKLLRELESLLNSIRYY